MKDKKIKRKKPDFLRKDWHKKITLGSKIKKKRKWRAAKGRHNKIRLKEKGYAKKPSIGFGADKRIKRKINMLDAKRIENIKQAEKVKKGEGIIIGKIGKKKRQEIIKIIEKSKGIILNRYIKSQENKNATH